MRKAELLGFFDELEKLGGLPQAALIAVMGGERLKESTRRHRKVLRALEEGYPAGWVALGMKPDRTLPY